MPAWIPITTADLVDSKVAALVTALRTKALGAGQTDPSPRIIQGVVTDVRRKIASCRSNQVAVDITTVPASLQLLAIDLILARMKGRLEIELTQFENDQLRRHDETLNRIASCADVIEQPDDAIAAPTQAAAGTPSVNGDRRAERLRRAG